MPPDHVPHSHRVFASAAWRFRTRARGAGASDRHAPESDPGVGTEIFAWFEDLSQRRRPCGTAGLPECLLPVAAGLRVVERRYAEGHLHLLRAVRLRCQGSAHTAVAALYVSALAAGTLAWIRTGRDGERAWLATAGTCAG